METQLNPMKKISPFEIDQALCKATLATMKAATRKGELTAEELKAIEIVDFFVLSKCKEVSFSANGNGTGGIDDAYDPVRKLEAALPTESPSQEGILSKADTLNDIHEGLQEVLSRSINTDLAVRLLDLLRKLSSAHLQTA